MQVNVIKDYTNFLYNFDIVTDHEANNCTIRFHIQEGSLRRKLYKRYNIAIIILIMFYLSFFRLDDLALVAKVFEQFPLFL